LCPTRARSRPRCRWAPSKAGALMSGGDGAACTWVNGGCRRMWWWGW
jgi:hypothetical protein